MRPGNHAPGGFLIFAGEGDVLRVDGMQDLGSMAQRVLQASA
jgi:hypothetical protein